MKKPNETTGTKRAISVDNARVLTYQGKDSVLFNMTIDGITIYNCKVVEGKNGDFISFPQTKDKNGKYWNVCFTKLTDEETTEICNMVEVMINNK